MTGGGPTERVGATFEAPDAEALVDPRLRGLVERYASLVGGSVNEVEQNLLEFVVPSDQAAHFRRRRQILVALSLAVLERYPEAELPVVGSALLQDLVDAVRDHGFRRSYGLLPPTSSSESQGVSLSVPTRAATVGTPLVGLFVEPLGRLVARVTVSAGSGVEEHLVESSVFDLAGGSRVGDDVVALCADLASGRAAPATDGLAGSVAMTEPRPMEELVELMLHDLEERLAPDVTRRLAETQNALAAELARLERYYATLLQEASEVHAGPADRDARRAIEVEHRRRRLEEERRHKLRAEVHPLQLITFSVLTQHVEWSLRTPAGRHGTLTARRLLSGTGAWEILCPTCGKPPTELRVCRHDHVACGACAAACSVCDEDCCSADGLASCHLDGRPACDEHSHACPSCRRTYCSAHEGECTQGGHRACVSCLGPCGVCGRVICATHASQSLKDAPLGARRLCADCVVYCEGGRNEPVGRDEAVRCASCDRYVCQNHQATCAVDNLVHCSKHLRRTDRSRRLVCEKHRGQCGHEPHVIFASDEVVPCATCGTATCEEHGGICAGDGLRHCKKHLAKLNDTEADYGCEKHRSMCHVDRRAYTIAGTATCPACGLPTCSPHMAECVWCGRRVCVTDRAASKRCSTCGRLRETTDPTDALISAGLQANGGVPPTAKQWLTARDATHTVVELDLGWTRKLVFAVRHGDVVPDRVVRHWLLGRSSRG